MKRPLGLVIGLLAVMGTVLAAPKATDLDKKKEALRELQDFIGGWKGSGSTRQPPAKSDPFWDETVQWNWRFKGEDCWLNVEFKGGKFIKSADVHYLLDKKKYQLTATPIEGKEKLVFDGALKDEKLIFEHIDPKTKDVVRIRMNTAAEGIRFMYYVEKRTSGGTIWRPQVALASTKIGESLAKKDKGPECVVSGGLGTMTVSFNGETFYVCCSGCADAFKEDPKKYVDEFKARKGKK